MLSARGVQSAEPQSRSCLRFTAPSVVKATRGPGETDAAQASGDVSTRGSEVVRPQPRPARRRSEPAELGAPLKRVWSRARGPERETRDHGAP